MLHFDIKNQRIYRWISILFIIFGLFLTRAVMAHPHSFIEMKNSLVITDNQLTGMKMTWTMDPLTSADLLYDAGNAANGSEIWKQLAAEVMVNVIGQHYFTELYHEGKKVKFLNRPSEYHLSREGNNAILSFEMLLAKPQPLNAEFTLMTYDPTYYVDMTYTDDKSVTLPIDVQARCTLKVITPKPDTSLKAYALNLDKADAPDEDMELGKQFAQRVEIKCH